MADERKLWDAATPEEEERYKSIIRERVKDSPFYQLIGMEVTALAPGKATISMPVSRKHHNLGGIVHGGAITSVADAAAGVALATLLTPGVERPITVEIKVNFCAPVINGVLRANGSVLQKGSRIAVCEAEVLEGDRLIAKGIATYMVLRGDEATIAGGD